MCFGENIISNRNSLLLPTHGYNKKQEETWCALSLLVILTKYSFIFSDVQFSDDLSHLWVLVHIKCQIIHRGDVVLPRRIKDIELEYWNGSVFYTELWPTNKNTRIKLWCWVRVLVKTLSVLLKARHFKTLDVSFGWGPNVVGPMCCVMQVKEPSARIVKRRGLCPGVPGLIGSLLWHISHTRSDTLVAH